MTDEERQRKNAICDRLMKEGIDGMQDAKAVACIFALTDLGVELGRKDSIACALAWHEALDQKGLCGETAIMLDFNRANAIAGERFGTEWQWEQPTLAREIFCLRRAVSNPMFSEIPDILRCMCLNNLGNRCVVAGRVLEALDCWRRVLDVQPNFGMSLCNRARTLTNYAHALEDTDERALFLWVAHKEATAAIAPTAVYANVLNDERNRESTKKLKEWIESVIDLKGIAAQNFLIDQDSSATEEERDYREWCLLNYLFLNPLNDLGPCRVATRDSIGLTSHVVSVDAPHRFASFFDQLMQEYVSARLLLYEGLTATMPHFSDRHVLVQATAPLPALCLAIEKVKAAYRTSYSLFDKIGFFMNAYMELRIPEKQVSFRRLWRAGENGPIRQEFDRKDNWGFCALYWLTQDFFEKTTDSVAEPQARGLSDIRNHIEHKYLRVTAAESPAIPPDDLALTVTRNHFEAKAMHLLKLARSALIYLAVGVGYEEKRRESLFASEPTEEIPAPPYISDTEKV